MSNYFNTITKLSESEFGNYTDFLLKNELSLFYLSIEYKELLEHLLGCESQYLIAKNSKGSIVGAFPLMISKKGKIGRVANSLPYYGSNGGIIVDQSLSNQVKNEIRTELYLAGENCIRDCGCVASTIVSSPFDNASGFYKENVSYDFMDHRIGQITCLPLPGVDLETRLMQMLQDPRPRNIRKARKTGVSCGYGFGEDELNFLYTTHQTNMKAIGGLAKDKEFFLLVPKIFHHSQYRVYVAEKDGEKVAAILLFYFNKTVEYFTPVVVEDARKYQPTALIIFEAMKDAVNEGYRYWNWGGTWASQNGVYDFKKRWGALDYPYSYFIKLYGEDILSSSKSDLLHEYPGFYVVPFNQIN